MTHRPRKLPLILLSLVATIAMTTTGCTAPPDPGPSPAIPVDVSVRLDKAPDTPIRIGVVVPVLQGEGSEYRPLAEGAGIAAYRLRLGGSDVHIITALDDGTRQGAADATRTLMDSDVAGIVMAATGAHTDQALQNASDAGMPVILPYGHVTGELDGVWSIAPSATAVAAQTTVALREVAATKPFLVTRESTITGGNWVGTAPATSPSAVAEQIVSQFEQQILDCVVIAASAREQAAMVVALQSRLGAAQLPIIVTPEALTPAFSDSLETADTSNGWLLSMGTPTVDQVALTHGPTGEHVAAFLNALRIAIGDPACRNIYDDDSCAATAGHADTASHDAVIALAKAVVTAGATDPRSVTAALDGLAVTPDDGLAGPELTFTQADARLDDQVTVLHASRDDPGLRPPTNPATHLFWFQGASA